MGFNMSSIQNLYEPLPYNTQKTDEITAKLKERLTKLSLTEKALKISLLSVSNIFGYSPYLTSIALKYDTFTFQLFHEGPDNALQEIFDELEVSYDCDMTIAQLMENLRISKAKIALCCGVADLLGLWPLEKITTTLSQFAAKTLNLSLAYLLTREALKGNIELPLAVSKKLNPSICNQCGFFVLAMGKLGANELNYSSDIDLIALYDPDKIIYTGRKTISHFYVMITQELMQIMERRTMHGYVFRTDLRLRPDPGSTPAAISVYAAETYYHTVAVNWERSAMIKASVIAGDTTCGQAYLDNLSSWIWRRSMDFAAIQDIAAIKNHLNQHYEQADKDFEGYNVKLGKGGIREIEFFCQINQLLYGGRHPAIRVKPTLEALDTLVTENLIDTKVCQDLSKAYHFLRTLEHRLQMVNDEQTHSLPDDKETLTVIASFMGFVKIEAFKETLVHHTALVAKHYQALLPDEGADTANIYSQGNIEGKLAELGYHQAASMAKVTASWRSGKYRALRTERSQKLLEECLPSLIEAFAMMSDPDGALSRFDSFLSKLPSGVQLFALFQANPSLFALMARVMGLAPALADTLAKKTMLWELLLEPNFFEPIENDVDLKTHLSSMIERARDYQDVLDVTRQFAEEYRFRVGVQMLENIASTDECMQSLSRIADVVLCGLIPKVEAEFNARYGTFDDGGLAVLAMGKYGGHELTHTSDLDIVFLYHVSDMAQVSNGDRALGPSQYYSRLGQNIITSITALTSEGRLYEVDTRLRPSGNQGPLVVTLDTFRDYYSKQAWTWEHMALTRARIICEPTGLEGKLLNEIRSILTKERDQKSLLSSVAEMRQKLWDANKTDNIWSIKHVRGGLIDIEFICQYLLLKEGEKYPDIFSSHIDTALNQLTKHDLLDVGISNDLISARAFMQNIQAVLRLCLGDTIQGDEFSSGLKEILCRSAKIETFEDLKEILLKTQSRIYKHFQTLIDIPALDLVNRHEPNKDQDFKNNIAD
jgi:glutamate-ammonia-ligase adenylyltransferase